MGRLPLTILILALTLAALLPSCGGSDSSLSKEEFIKEADAICKKTDKVEAGEAVAYLKAHSKTFQGLSREAANEKLIVAIGIPSLTRETEELEALGAPSGEEKKVATILSAIRTAIKASEQNPASAETRPGGPFARPTKLASEYGFNQCREVI